VLVLLTGNLCDYKRADYLLMKQKISEIDWVNLIASACDIHGAVSDFTSIFLKIASILFRCCLYFDSVSTDFTLRKVLRKRSRIRISLLKVESNQTLSSFLIITSLVGMHILAIFYKRKIWDYKRADYLLMKQKISEIDWVNLITSACDIHGAVSDFTSIFL
jgi:hypothetical protein